MTALILGATGYVGSHVAAALIARGHEVTGVARSAANEKLLAKRGVAAVSASFDDLSRLASLAAGFDIVVMCAMMPFEAELPLMNALIDACRSGSTTHLLFTSGTGVLSIESLDGQWSQYTFAEDDPFPFAARYNRLIRLKTENLVREASSGRLRTYVIRPPLIFGNAGSIQVPQFFESACKTGSACYLGAGLNLYSTVHVEDLAEVYCLALERGIPGALYHAVSGEANFRYIAEAVAEVVGCDAKSLNYAEACELWGKVWVDLALAVNSRSVAKRTVAELGWSPQKPDLIEDIRSGSYRRHYEGGGLRDYAWSSHG
jgi:nucleoside-diphosphate-sugar epimerase